LKKLHQTPWLEWSIWRGVNFAGRGGRIFQADVDLVMRGAVKNKVIAKEIDRTKKLIYAA
jgi:hypothetical protein